MNLIHSTVEAFEAGMTALNQFLAADSLKGSAYDNAKSYASNVLLPLIQAVILYAESVSEKTSSLGTLYASYSDESLDSEALESQIRQHENSWRSTNAMYKLLLQDEGSSASSTQRLLSSMDSMQSEIRELREKLQKLNAFNTATFQTFADTATLEGTLLTVFNQVKQDFGSYSPGKGFPSYNKKNLDWAQGVDSQWGKRSKKITKKTNKSKQSDDNILEDLLDILFGSTHTTSVSAKSTNVRTTNFWGSSYTKYKSSIERDEDGIFKGKFEDGVFNGVAIDLKILSLDLDFSDWHLNAGTSVSIPFTDYKFGMNANLGINTDTSSPEGNVSVFGAGKNYSNNYGIKLGLDFINGIGGLYYRRDDITPITALTKRIDSTEFGIQTINGAHIAIGVATYFALPLVLAWLSIGAPAFN